jgi:hypothetical protein
MNPLTALFYGHDQPTYCMDTLSMSRKRFCSRWASAERTKECRNVKNCSCAIGTVPAPEAIIAYLLTTTTATACGAETRLWKVGEAKTAWRPFKGATSDPRCELSYDISRISQALTSERKLELITKVRKRLDVDEEGLCANCRDGVKQAALKWLLEYLIVVT